jgi:hypothetical protein
MYQRLDDISSGLLYTQNSAYVMDGVLSLPETKAEQWTT